MIESLYLSSMAQTILQVRLGAMLVDLDGVKVIGHTQNAVSAISYFLSSTWHRENRD